MNADSVYAKPVAPRIVVRPALASLALHGFLVAAVTLNWIGAEPEVVRIKTVPKVINARLVDVSEFQKPQPAPKPKAAAKPKPKPKVAKPQPKPAPKPQPKPTPKPAPAKAKPEVAPKVEPKPEPRITQEELAALTRADMLRNLASEDEALEATATADELTASYAALIQQTVVNYRSRPPSARNGMIVELEVQLVPTGEVVNVRVRKSSGNSAFDRSAMNAVEKARSFPELSNLPSREFEKDFRKFILIFNPEDLRY